MLKILTPSDIATTLRIPVRAVYRLIAQRKLKALRIGRKLRIMEKDLEEYINEQYQRNLI